jgi:uracil phosphoribosyltransferase
MPSLAVISHPLAQAALTRLRARTTEPPEFRRYLKELAALVFIEATRQLEVSEIEVTTPLAKTRGVALTRPIILAPVLRAALGMVDGIWPVAPQAQIGHLGIYRDELTARPRPYYSKLPPGLESADVFVLDPMVATGQSAVEAVNQLKAYGARRLCFLSIITCPTGIENFHRAHPDVPLFTVAVDLALDDRYFIVPGLGDAGDRCFFGG